MGTTASVTQPNEITLVATSGMEAIDYFFAFSDYPDVLYRDIDFFGLEFINNNPVRDSSLGRFVANVGSFEGIPKPSSYALLAGVVTMCVACLRRRRWLQFRNHAVSCSGSL